MQYDVINLLYNETYSLSKKILQRAFIIT